MDEQPGKLTESPIPHIGSTIERLVTGQSQDTIAQAEALENMALLLTGMFEKIEALEQATKEQSEDIALLAAAALGMPCPKVRNDPTVKDEDAIASVQTCMTYRECDCDTGVALGKLNNEEPYES